MAHFFLGTSPKVNHVFLVLKRGYQTQKIFNTAFLRCQIKRNNNQNHHGYKPAKNGRKNSKSVSRKLPYRNRTVLNKIFSSVRKIIKKRQSFKFLKFA